jgi:stalled ribosome rescue protein Dom34
MKKSSFLVLICLLTLGISLAFTKSSADSKRISFTVTESDDFYEISAEYNKSKIEKVQFAVNKSMKPTVIFTSEKDDFSKTITLDDKTQLVVKTTPGKMKIKLDKTQNSKASLERLKSIVPRIKEALN